MQILSKEEFLAADDLPLVPVPLPPDLYGADSGFNIRSVSGTERSALETAFSGIEMSEHPGFVRGSILLKCVVDAQGEPIFSEEDREFVMGKNAGTLELLFAEACRVNGFSKKDQEELEKNSEEGQSDDSSTDCA